MSQETEANDGGLDPGDRAFGDAVRAALSETVSVEAISGAPSPTALLERIVRTAAQAIPSPEGALFLVDHERQVLTFEVVIGATAAHVQDLTIPLGHGIVGLVAASCQALAISNAQDDPRHARDVAERSGYLPTTILAVPVQDADGETIGVLELLDRQGQPSYSLADIELLGLFAGQIGIALRMRLAHDLLGARLGDALALVGGIPASAQDHLSAQAEHFARRLAGTPSYPTARHLAALVAAIAGRGPAARDLCVDVLSAVATYLDAAAGFDQEPFR